MTRLDGINLRWFLTIERRNGEKMRTTAKEKKLLPRLGVLGCPCFRGRNPEQQFFSSLSEEKLSTTATIRHTSCFALL